VIGGQLAHILAIRVTTMPSKTMSHEFNGIRYAGHLAWSDTHTGKRPGVLVIHEATGIGDHAKDRANRIASELGYTAFAMDLFGENPTTVDGMIGWITRLLSDPADLHGRLKAALATLASQETVDPARLGVIGYCFGGTAAIELGRCGADVKAIVAFHAGLQGTATSAKNISGKVLVCNGAQDPFMPNESLKTFVEEMIAAGVDWQMQLLGSARHSYTNIHAGSFGSDAYAYDPSADARSWRSMAGLFAEAFG
jgi:dienelactone hydrolase